LRQVMGVAHYLPRTKPLRGSRVRRVFGDNLQRSVVGYAREPFYHMLLILLYVDGLCLYAAT